MCYFNEVRTVEKAFQYVNEHLEKKTIFFDGFIPFPTNEASFYSVMYNEKTRDYITKIGKEKADFIFQECMKHIVHFETSRGAIIQLGQERPLKANTIILKGYYKYPINIYYIKIFNVVDCKKNEIPVVDFHPNEK